jgi:hypothetical protein
LPLQLSEALNASERRHEPFETGRRRADNRQERSLVGRHS